ncbi:hypothetical protein A9Q99_24475 [Gammaproteobacteria bacterium 45_16_T64]|nr:hypothetical protein A9Q99_24475 [Gammaproteobacteria bacterium 45_16_T64]
MKIPFLLISIFFVTVTMHTNAANVTSWGSNNPQGYTSQLIGRWALLAVYEKGQNLSNNTAQSDYWIFKRNGFIELREGEAPLKRSYFTLSNRKLTIKDKKTREKRHFTIKYIDQKRLILILSQEGVDHTYNFERY